MKKFEVPEIEVIKFQVEDIITASSGDEILPDPTDSVGAVCVSV